MKQVGPRDAEVLVGPSTRRAFLRRSTLLGTGLAASLSLPGLLAACRAPQQAPPASTTPSTSTTLTAAAEVVPQGFDTDIHQPGAQLGVVQIYEPLVDYPVGATTSSGGREIDTSKVEGHLAESWQLASNGLSYTMKLRQGVKSPYGNELNAEDVKFGFDKSATQKGGTGIFLTNVVNIKSVEVVDRYTVRFGLSAPSPFFLSGLTLYAPGIYDSTELKKHATADDPFATKWLVQNSAGYGPYTVESVTPDEQAVLVANPNYYGKKPYFQKVIIRQVPDPATRASLVATGQVDWADNLPFKQLDLVAGSGKGKVQAVTGNLQQRAMMNPNFPPFDKKEVRQAFNYATPHDAILSDVYEGRATQAKSPVESVIPGYDGSFWHYETDYAKAKQLLSQAGYGNGLDVTLSYSDLTWADEQFAVQIQAGLKNAGVNVTLQKLPSDQFLARTNPGKRDVPFFVYYEQSIILDAGYQLFLEAVPEGAGDKNAYKSEQVSALVAQANSTLDNEKRMALVRQVQQIHVDDASWIYGVVTGAQAAMSAGLDGWVWHPDNNVRYADLHR